MLHKFLKTTLLLMISWIVTGITFFGCNPVALAWYSAVCSLPIMGAVTLPIIMMGIYYYQGIFSLCKYAFILITTYTCINIYRKNTKNPSPFILAAISVVTMMAMEGADYALTNIGNITWSSFKMITYIPIIMLNWSTTIMFSYGINKFMISGYVNNRSTDDTKYSYNNEKVAKTAEAFKNIAAKMRNINSEYQGEYESGSMEKHIDNCICQGCANSEIQYLERARLNYLWFNKMVETREAMAMQFSEVSKIVEKVCEPHATPDILDDIKQEKIRKKFKEKGLYIRKIRIFENEKGCFDVSFCAKRKKKSKATIENMREVMSQCLDRKMRMVNLDFNEIPIEYENFYMLEEVNFHTLYGNARIAKNNEKISGDNYSWQVLERGQVFMSICDGMGFGASANEYSDVIIDLLEQLMESGLEESTILRLINSILLTKGGWNVSTSMDMGMIDLYSGNCRFLKSGAASTFIKRGNWVECIKSTSLPIGVFNEIDVESITKKLYDGDFVIMMSDGIVEAMQCTDKEKAMAGIIMDIETNNPKEMALVIMNEAIKYANGIPKDDMTVLVTGLWKVNHA